MINSLDELLTRFLEDQQTEDAIDQDYSYKESSTVAKLFYFLFGMAWVCVLCQMARMFQRCERRDQEEYVQAAEQAQRHGSHKNEKRRAKLKSLFVRRQVVRVSTSPGTRTGTSSVCRNIIETCAYVLILYSTSTIDHEGKNSNVGFWLSLS